MCGTVNTRNKNNNSRLSNAGRSLIWRADFLVRGDDFAILLSWLVSVVLLLAASSVTASYVRGAILRYRAAVTHRLRICTAID